MNLAVTRYHQKTEDAIVAVRLDPATGFAEVFANGAEWRNWGWEVTLDLLLAQARDFSWRISTQWATNKSMVDTLLGSNITLQGFTGMTVRVLEEYPFPVFWGNDFVRFGRDLTVGGVNIDSTYSDWSEGDLYICSLTNPLTGTSDQGCVETGQPLTDGTGRLIGDPNPDWTGSLRTTFTFFDKLRLSGLLDVKHGGTMWNGTRGALYYFGAHKDTERFHGEGVDTVFASCAGCGPGAGTEVNLNWDTWFLGGPGSGFTGPGSQFMEDAGFVKIRDVSLSYTWEAAWLGSIGFNALDITVSGRNLVTWTSYTGLDPESNLLGQSTGRGLDYFNHPQTRSFVFTLTFRR